jgi:hypothetical protein
MLLFVCGCMATEPTPASSEVAPQPGSAEGAAVGDDGFATATTGDEPVAAPNNEHQAGSESEDPKMDECNALIGAINDAQGALKDVKGNEPTGLQRLATTLDGVAEGIEAVELSDTELVELRDGYVAMARDLSKASRGTADALRANDDQKAKEGAKVMATSGQRERRIVDDINTYCTP